MATAAAKAPAGSTISVAAPAARTSFKISATIPAGTPCSPRCSRTRRASAGSASQASSTGSVSFPSCRS